ncbi:MAG: nitrogen fixation protein NifZ [Isosphaeraceae bacterium]
MKAVFDYGDMVRVIRSIRNGGTFPGVETGVQLVRAGNVGYVRNIGTYLQEQIIYAVHFIGEDRVVGCREEVLVSIDAPWTVTRFLFRDRVVTRIPLAIDGQVVVDKGAEGEVVLRLGEGQEVPSYHVDFNGHVFEVPETALDAAPIPGQDPNLVA